MEDGLGLGRQKDGQGFPPSDTMALKALAFGERYCHDFWNWHYEYAESVPITILEGEHEEFIPFIVKD